MMNWLLSKMVHVKQDVCCSSKSRLLVPTLLLLVVHLLINLHTVLPGCIFIHTLLVCTGDSTEGALKLRILDASNTLYKLFMWCRNRITHNDGISQNVERCEGWCEISKCTIHVHRETTVHEAIHSLGLCTESHLKWEVLYSCTGGNGCANGACAFSKQIQKHLWDVLNLNNLALLSIIYNANQCWDMWKIVSNQL